MTAERPLPLDILVVDDRDENHQILDAQFKAAGAWKTTVERAYSCADALKAIQRRGFDLIFLDYRLPDGNGLDVLDKIRQFHPKTAVVLMTGSGDERLAVSAMKKGALEYLNREDLLRADIDQLFRRVVETRYLVNQNMELRQLNQMKNEFIANVSHELRTPLSVIIGYAETLKVGSLGPINEPQAKALHSIIGRAEELLKALNRILQVREQANAPAAELKPLELKAFLTRFGASAPAELERKKMRLCAALPAAEVWVQADASQLSQALENVVSNAVKFGPAGSAVTLGLQVHGEEALISVRDEGPGVPQEMLPRLFERFSTAELGPTRQHAGLGLGLPLSKAILERHSGRIWLESKGAGCTAFLALPLAPAAGKTPGEGRQRVLLVEDNPDAIDVIKLFLSTLSSNLDVVAAHTGFEALESVQNHRPHLVILDVMMPGMDGYEVITRLRRSLPTKDLPIIVLTGYTEALTKAKEVGADAVLLKPFERAAFLQQVRRLLGANFSRPHP